MYYLTASTHEMQLRLHLHNNEHFKHYQEKVQKGIALLTHSSIMRCNQDYIYTIMITLSTISSKLRYNVAAWILCEHF